MSALGISGSYVVLIGWLACLRFAREGRRYRWRWKPWLCPSMLEFFGRCICRIPIRRRETIVWHKDELEQFYSEDSGLLRRRSRRANEWPKFVRVSNEFTCLHAAGFTERRFHGLRTTTNLPRRSHMVWSSQVLLQDGLIKRTQRALSASVR